MAYVVRETVLDKTSRKKKFVEVYSNNVDTSVCLSIQCQEREDKDISGNNGWMTSWKGWSDADRTIVIARGLQFR